MAVPRDTRATSPSDTCSATSAWRSPSVRQSLKSCKSGAEKAGGHQAIGRSWQERSGETDALIEASENRTGVSSDRRSDAEPRTGRPPVARMAGREADRRQSVRFRKVYSPIACVCRKDRGDPTARSSHHAAPIRSTSLCGTPSVEKLLAEPSHCPSVHNPAGQNRTFPLLSAASLQW